MGVAAIRWGLGFGGPLAAPPVIAMGILRSQQSIEAPDLRLLISGLTMGSKPWFPVNKPGSRRCDDSRFFDLEGQAIS